jgi:trk system potassium uptake protein TrkH
VQWYLSIIAGITAAITLWQVVENNSTLSEALRHAAFNTVSVMTTTGFASADYAVWGHFSTMLIFMVTVIGGCTGSTAGGIKIFRYQVLYETAKVQICQLLQPHGVFIPRYNGKPIPENVTSAVLGFFILFAFCFMVLSVLMSSMGIDFLTSMSGVAQAMANVGPGLGHIIGPAGNFSTMPDGAKWLLSFAMLLGRLELFTLLVLFSPQFWRS